MPDSPENLIRNIAGEIGFSLVGISDLSPCSEADGIFDKWLEAGKHGDMHFLSKGREKRKNPVKLLDDAKSAICVGLNYYTEALKRNQEIDGRDGRVVFSIYAHGRDYHKVMGDMLSELSTRLVRFFPRIKTTACVDTKPISDRSFALRSGIAWLGKNTNVISPEFGSWIFLGELLTNIELKAGTPLECLCGDCTLCIDSCPTGAIEKGCIVDARKCISYLTIEKRGEILKEFHGAIGLNIYGCDECQSVCPYNSVAKESLVFRKEERNPLVDKKLKEIAQIDDKAFEKLTGDTVLLRCGAERLRRNAKIVMKNIPPHATTAEGGIP